MKALLLSAYAAHSHTYWQGGLRRMFADWDWQELTLPPRHFSWRVRGNPLYWALERRDVLESGHDLLIATSMVDLATLRGLVPVLAGIPTVVYFHENQFNYPVHRARHSLVDAQVSSIYSALAADCVLFNSRYNQESFLEGCSTLLEKLPDMVPPGVPALLGDKSQVLPVALMEEASLPHAPTWPGNESIERMDSEQPLRLLWSGRLEYDKGGEGLLRVLQNLEERKFHYELAIVGPEFREIPPVFKEIREGFAHRVVHFGYIEEVTQYRALLAGADIVLSTAIHEYQGIAVLEAVAQGCVPIVPDRLAYREMYPAPCRYASCPDEPGEEARAAAECIVHSRGELLRGVLAPPDITAFQAISLAPRYREVFEVCIAARR